MGWQGRGTAKHRPPHGRMLSQRRHEKECPERKVCGRVGEGRQKEVWGRWEIGSCHCSRNGCGMVRVQACSVLEGGRAVVRKKVEEGKDECPRPRSHNTHKGETEVREIRGDEQSITFIAAARQVLACMCAVAGGRQARFSGEGKVWAGGVCAGRGV